MYVAMYPVYVDESWYKDMFIDALIIFNASKCFTLQVLQEVLRLYPIAQEIMKQTKSGGMMLGKYYIPRATTAIVSHAAYVTALHIACNFMCISLCSC